MDIMELISDLASKGGAIVSSNECSEIEITDARITGRFVALPDGLGFVRRTKEWLDINKKREWKERYIARMITHGLDQNMAEADYEGGSDDHDYTDSPEDAADDSFSYYDD